MKWISLGFAMLAAMPVTAQQNPLKNAGKYGNTITAADLKKHLYIIASPEMEGRETATEGERKAAAYIENHFRSLGLLPGNNGSYRQYFNVYRDVPGNSELVVNGKAAVSGKDFVVTQGYSSTLYFSEVLYMKELADTAKFDVAGKAVLVSMVPQQGKSSPAGFQLIRYAARKGAAATFVATGSKLTVPRGGGLSVELYRKTMAPNNVYINVDLATAIVGSGFASGALQSGPVSVELKLKVDKQVEVLQSSNVLGVVEGSDKKDEYVFITAHYDHEGLKNGVLYPGADDDGSGTVAILEMAEAFAKAKADGKGPRRSVVFMTVSGEEKGLWGSAYYAAHPVFPLENTVVNLNIDMIGRVGVDYQKEPKDSGNYIYVIGDDKLSSDLRPISEAANKMYTKLKLDYKYNGDDPNRFYYRSDHFNFAKNGVPAIFYFNGVHEDYHKPTDTPDKINYQLAEKRTRLVFFTAWEMANRDQKVVRDRPL